MFLSEVSVLRPEVLNLLKKEDDLTPVSVNMYEEVNEVRIENEYMIHLNKDKVNKYISELNEGKESMRQILQTPKLIITSYYEIVKRMRIIIDKVEQEVRLTKFKIYKQGNMDISIKFNRDIIYVYNTNDIYLNLTEDIIKYANVDVVKRDEIVKPVNNTTNVIIYISPVVTHNDDKVISDMIANMEDKDIKVIIVCMYYHSSKFSFNPRIYYYQEIYTLKDLNIQPVLNLRSDTLLLYIMNSNNDEEEKLASIIDDLLANYLI